MTAARTMPAWKVETLRLTVFTNTVLDVEPIKWWEGVTGDRSESKTIQPRLNSLHEMGRIKDGLCNLSLEVQPSRIDWVFAAYVSQPVLQDFPTFAELPRALDLFHEVLDKWIAECPPAQRLAFGMVLIEGTNDKKSSYEELRRFLPAVKLDADNSSDFLYQINRKRASKTGIRNLNINRLSKWSAVKLSGMMLQLGTAEGQPAAKILQAGKELNGCRVELDINTAPDFEGVLPKESLQPVVKELIELAAEIAATGDTP